MQSKKWTLALALCVLVSLLSSPCTAEDFFPDVDFRIDAEVTDVANIVGVLRLKLALKSYEAEGDPDPKALALAVRYLRKNQNKVKTNYWTVGGGLKDNKLLRAHKRLFGLGVFGPLKISGSLKVEYDLPTERIIDVWLVGQKIEGPKGSWQASPTP